MHLLSGCESKPGKIDETLVALAKNHVTELLDKFVEEPNLNRVIQHYIKDGDFASLNVLLTLKSKKLAFLTGPYRSKIMSLRIPCKSSRRLYGIADPYGLLKEGQVYVRLSKEKTLTGKVLVTKEPCLHRGDLRILEAVDFLDGYDYLNDVIVFSCKGERPTADMIAGSDLDGDQYFVSWLPALVDAVQEFTPGQFDESYDNTREFDPDVFKDLIGLRHLYADRYGKDWTGIHWPTMEKLCTLVNRAVDAPKKGNITVLVDGDTKLLENFPGYPHYALGKKGPLRLSKSIVGKVFNAMVETVSSKLGYKGPNYKISIEDDRQHMLTYFKRALCNFIRNKPPEEYEKSVQAFLKNIFFRLLINSKDQRVQMVSETLNIFWRFSFLYSRKTTKLVIFNMKTSSEISENILKRLSNCAADEHCRVITLPYFNQEKFCCQKEEISDATCDVFSIDFNSWDSLVEYLFVDAQKKVQLENNVNTIDRTRVETGVFHSDANLEAFHALDDLYGMGILETDQNRAIQYFLKSAEKNYGPACTRLGEIYEFGDGVEVDLNMACKYYLKAYIIAKRSIPEKPSASKYISRKQMKLLLSKVDLKSVDLPPESIIEIALMKANTKYAKDVFHYHDMTFVFADCANDLASLLHSMDEFKSSLEYYLEAAQYKNTEALFQIGRMYEKGEGVIKDIESAFQNYKKAAEIDPDKPHPEACYFLGLHHLKYKRDNKLAWKWFNKAATLQVTDAYIVIAKIYLKGMKGITEPNVDMAIHWLEKAIALGNEQGQLELGKLYLKQNKHKLALNLFSDLALQGNQEGQFILALCLLDLDKTLAMQWMSVLAQNEYEEAITFFANNPQFVPVKVEEPSYKRKTTRKPTFSKPSTD